MKKEPEPQVNEVSDEEWVKGYNEYCKNTGKRLTVSPLWKLRDDGTFSMILQYGVEKIQ